MNKSSDVGLGKKRIVVSGMPNIASHIVPTQYVLTNFTHMPELLKAYFSVTAYYLKAIFSRADTYNYRYVMYVRLYMIL